MSPSSGRTGSNQAYLMVWYIPLNGRTIQSVTSLRVTSAASSANCFKLVRLFVYVRITSTAAERRASAGQRR